MSTIDHIFREALELPDEILLDERAFSTIRFGDLVAVATLSKALKVQYNWIRTFIKRTRYLQDILGLFEPNFSGIVTEDHLKPPFPISLNIWSVYTYLYNNFGLTPDLAIKKVLDNNRVRLNINPILKLCRFKPICIINPLFPMEENFYNHDRFFPISFTLTLIEIVRERGFKIILINSRRNKRFISFIRENVDKLSDIIPIKSGNILDFIYLLYHSDLYIGGDTGSSHIAAVTPGSCINQIYLYGNLSKKRHSEMEPLAEKILPSGKKGYKDYSPKPTRDKKIYYSDKGFNEKVLNNISNYLDSVKI